MLVQAPMVLEADQVKIHNLRYSRENDYRYFVYMIFITLLLYALHFQTFVKSTPCLNS